MHKLLRNSILIITAMSLAACGHSLPFVKDKPTQNATVCEKMDEPPREPLANFTFFPLPPNTVAPGGVQLVAGLTADGVTDILSNHQKLKRREEKWQLRAKASNDCLVKEAKDRPKG